MNVTEILKILLAIIPGTIIYAISKFFTDAILEQRTIIAKIKDALIYYSNVYLTPSKEEIINEASIIFRQLGASLEATLIKIPCYKLFSWLGIIKKQEVVREVGNTLIGLSNSCLRMKSINLKQNITGDEIERILENNQSRADNINNFLKLNIKF